MIESVKLFLRQTPRWVEVVSFISIIVTIVLGMNAYFVKAEEFNKLELRVEQKIISDRADQLEQREWKLEDRYSKLESMPNEIKSEYRKIKTEKIQLRNALDKLTNKLIDVHYASIVAQ